MSGLVILTLGLAYLIGSIPFAYRVTYHLRRVDIRTLGDGNPGGKNVFHQVSPLAGILVALLDIGKGMAAIFLAQALGLSDMALLWVGVAVIAGHNWSIFLQLRGGQGMATTVGVFFALMPAQTLAAILIIAVMLLVLHNWDRACAIGFGSLPLLEWWTNQRTELIVYTIALLPLIGIRKWMQQGSPLPGVIARRVHRSP
jgi:glycerol-3-phosphate acyltransferase PlsY